MIIFTFDAIIILLGAVLCGEVAIIGAKRPRRCGGCNGEGHDSRNCKQKQQSEASLVVPPSNPPVSTGLKRGPKPKSRHNPEDDLSDDGSVGGDKSDDESDDENPTQANEKQTEPEQNDNIDGTIVVKVDNHHELRVKYEGYVPIDLTADSDSEEEEAHAKITDPPHLVGLPEFLEVGRSKKPNSLADIVELQAATTPGQFFSCLIDQTMLEQWVASSNAYASLTISNRKWIPLTVERLKSFIAIILFLGVLKHPSMADA